jgi:Flp pilus assembly pilin Flp
MTKVISPEMKKATRSKERKKAERSRGATAVEYAVMLALIVVVVLSAVTFIGRKASKTFSRVGSAMPN